MPNAHGQSLAFPHCKDVGIEMPNFPRTMNADDQRTYLYANNIDGKNNQLYRLTGDVGLHQGTLWLEATDASYQRMTREFSAQGHVRVGDVGMEATGNETFYNLDTERGYLLNSDFKLAGNHANGGADSIVMEGPGLLTLHNASYSTCDADDSHWRLHASSIRLNRNTGFGSASSSYLTVYDVPVMFLPYVTFPIDDRRKTGFLAPGWGTSSTDGTTLRIPYYINLAPNYDATLTLVNMSRRGLLADLEARHISENTNSTINASLLQSDNIYGDDRFSTAFWHEGQLNRRWRSKVDVGYVSDADYFADLGNDLSRAATSQVNEEITLNYAYDTTTASATLQGYYTIDDALPKSAQPYWQLPGFTLLTTVPLPTRQFALEIPAEYINFHQENRVSGHRVHVAPMLSMPIEKAAGYITPSITLFQSNYELTNTEGGSAPASQNRTIPAVSLDTGLFFEREFVFGDNAYLHTIEPRLFFVHIPYKAQTDHPVFNTTENTFSFNQLFYVNRFAGPDRIGDTRQVTAAITSRWLDDDDGRILATASLGQIFYDRDRVVNVSNAAPQTTSQSDIAAAFSLLPASWLTITGDFIWSAYTDVIDKGVFQTQLNFGGGRVINAGYRYDRTGILEQEDHSFAWPLGNRWKAVGRWNYSHPDDLPLETMGGLAYDNCCWALRLLHHRFYLSETTDYNESFMVELELKGLGGIGNPIESVVAQSVPGYGGF